jgi:hypothetical protein
MMIPLPSPITRTEDHGTVTFRGARFALDVTKCAPTLIHPDQDRDPSWHSTLDDDPAGSGVSKRLHVYGRDSLMEIRLLVDRALEEIDRQENAHD